MMGYVGVYKCIFELDTAQRQHLVCLFVFIRVIYFHFTFSSWPGVPETREIHLIYKIKKGILHSHE